MPTWDCLFCGNKGNTTGICPVCGYMAYNPSVTPSPTQVSSDPSLPTRIQPPIETIPVEQPTPLPQTSYDEEAFRFMNKTENPDGSITILDSQNGYTILYTKEKGYVGYLNGKEKYHIYPPATDGDSLKMVSIKLYDEESIRINNGNENLILYESDLTIGDMSNTMKVKDQYNNTYVIKDGVLERIALANGDIRTIVDDELILLKQDGTFESDNYTGKYMYDEMGYLVCARDDGKTVTYDTEGTISKCIDENGIIHNYAKNSISRNINGKIRYSIVNHIEYDDEAYDNVLKTLNEIGETLPTNINKSINEVENTINSLPDKYDSDVVSSISSSISDDITFISKLSEMTNYSLLAYQECDSSLQKQLYSLIDALFSDRGDIYSELYKESIKNKVEVRDGIIEYKEDAFFVNPANSKYLSDIDLILRIGNFLYVGDFVPERFNLTNLEVYDDLKTIYYSSGEKEMNRVMYALSNNCPDNFFEYNFNPQALYEGNGHYDFNENICLFDTNSEFISINGYTFEFTQVLPQRCNNKSLLLAYDFCKANVINTMRTLPSSYLETANQKNRTIVLTCSHYPMNNFRDSWGGYYNSGMFLNPEDGTIVIDAHRSFVNSEYYTRDVVIHELGHKFDDILNKKGKFDSFGKFYLTDDSPEWASYRDKYSGVLPAILPNSYSEENLRSKNVTEFFAEAMVAYFVFPDELRAFCPEVYEAISDYLGGDYGGAYIDNIDMIAYPNG